MSILQSSYFNNAFLKQWSRCFFTSIFFLQNPLSESGSQAALVKCPIRNKIQPVLPVYYKIVIIVPCALYNRTLLNRLVSSVGKIASVTWTFMKVPHCSRCLQTESFVLIP